MSRSNDLVLDFEKFLDHRVRVKFQGGREGLFARLSFLFLPFIEDMSV